jgi:hypothetical protein
MTDTCTKNSICTGESGPDHSLPAPPGNQNGCAPQIPGQLPGEGGTICPPKKDLSCKEFQLSKNRDNCFIDSVVDESLNIGGATLNIYKLLGVHEQGKLIDCTGHGEPLSNGDLPKYPAINAFDKYLSEWRSIQHGGDVTASAYIGYDFGQLKTNDDSRRSYGVDTGIYKHVTTILIKQSEDATRRVTRMRVERSDDGHKWYGVAIVLLPDDDCLNTIYFRESVPSRYWRFRPVDFNGVVANTTWGVQALQLTHEYTATDQYNIQDKVFLENRDRDYNTDPLPIKGSYDLVDVTTELSKYGIELPAQSLYISVGFSSCILILGRPLVIGDIIEIPSEAQFSSEMKRLEKWMEVTDVAWSTEGYTPGWQPTLLRIIAQPAYASQETQDLFGDLGQSEVPEQLGLITGEDGNDPLFQDYFDVSQTITAEAKDSVPEKGRQGSSTIRKWESGEIESAEKQNVINLNSIGLNPTGLYTEDAMPPNNASYTEGDKYPEGPEHGAYHRLTYDMVKSKNIPPRLHRYSQIKGRWVYLETDRRMEFNGDKPLLEEFLNSPYATHNDEITRNRSMIDDECEKDNE